MAQQDLKNNLDMNELQEAKVIIDALLRTNKVYALYEKSHSTIQQALEYLYKSLTSFTSKYGELSLEVKKDQLVYLEEVLYSGNAREGDIAYTLFRDGIRWLVFTDGIEYDELKTFVNVLHQYKTLAEDSEEDLVTSLWEVLHIQCKAVENTLDADSQGNSLVSGQSGPGSEPGSLPPDNEAEHLPAPCASRASSITEEARKGPGQAPVIDCASLELTAAEIEFLRQMVALEESADPTQQLFDILINMLHAQQDEKFFNVVLPFIGEELWKALVNAQFETAAGIFQQLQDLGRLTQGEKPWILSKIEKLLLVLFSVESLAVLKETWESCDKQHLDQMRQILLLLPVETIQTLALLLPGVSSPPVKDMLAEAIQHLAAQDLRPIENLLDSADEKVMEHLVDILARLDGDGPDQMLLTMTRYNSERIHIKILKALMQRNVWAPQKLFPLIESGSLSVRHLLLKYLGSRKSTLVEEFLIDYLREKRLSQNEKSYINACFRTLGLCGSDRSMKFLCEVLAKGGVFAKFSQSAARQGAAVALQYLGTDEAKKVLKDAARSYFPGVRRDIRTVISNR